MTIPNPHPAVIPAAIPAAIRAVIRAGGRPPLGSNQSWHEERGTR